MRYFNARMDQIVAANSAVGRLPDVGRADARPCCAARTRGRSTPSVGANPNDQPDVDTPLASRDPRAVAVRVLHPQSPTTRAGPIPTPVQRSVASAWRSTGSRSSPRRRRRARAAQAALSRPDRADAGLGGARCRCSRRRQRRYCFRTDAPVGGTVPATLSLTLGAPATLRRVHPGRREGLHGDDDRHGHLDRRRRDADASPTRADRPGRLVNGSVLAGPAAAGRGHPAVTVKTYAGAGVQRRGRDRRSSSRSRPASRCARARTSKTLTFTLSTTNP